ncbi:HEAT repeat domain-containing protein [Streptomyces sp. Tu102]|uniref:HEAT repeat domain-containing protein n=1 Tax=Streptomyces sp. Tu102 TaxID=2838019 RepID=UPI001BDCB7F8|nr:HEAT repeat domain-containing protein [Streptomyces sp. Tu102]MBT1093207.1 HEAT repeat domain-containing protein [Streptomyces sp. Tu102]
MGSQQQIAFFLRELEDGDTWRRAAAAKGLGRIGRDEHAWVLVGFADDRAAEVREGVAAGLGRLGLAEAGHAVLPGLMGDEDPWVRRRASRSAILLGLDGPAIVDAFSRLLRDPDHHLRINALDGLRALGVPGDAGALLALLGDPDWAVWGRARSLVFDFRKDPAVSAELVRTAEQGAADARVLALELLPEQWTERIRDSLVTGLRDEAPQVRSTVARRLADMEDKRSRDALAEALEAEQDAGVAELLIRLLAERGDERVTGPAIRWLGDAAAGSSAASALGAVGTRVAVHVLRTAVTDGALPGRTRAGAAKGIGQAGRWDAVWLLLPLLDDPDGVVRAGAVAGLDTLVADGLRFWERHSVARALVDHLAADPDTVWQTHNALIGLAEALPGLRRIVDRTPSADVRAAALSLLDTHNATDGDTEHDLARFVRALDDPDETVRHHAAEGLAHWVVSTGTRPRDEQRLRARLTDLAAGASQAETRAVAEEALRALDGCGRFSA